MPRLLVPSPNEESCILGQAKEKQKRERLIAARKQSLEWSKRRTNDHLSKVQKKHISDQLQATKSKLVDLDDKENDLQTQLNTAMKSVGEGFSLANTINAMEKDELKAKTLAEYRRIATERHRAALKQLNTAKKKELVKENKLVDLRKDTRLQEASRTKRLLENPLQNTQPLIQVPTTAAAVTHRPLHGLDAFTNTYHHLPSGNHGNHHLPCGVGVVDERSLAKEGGVKDAKASAEELERVMVECRDKLTASKQARAERADVRGSAALQQVQLKNVLEEVTSQLDKYAVHSRSKRKPSTLHTNVFASNLARENTLKQHQVDLEHAVEDMFDRQHETVDMVLPSSVKFEAVDSSLETIEEKSEKESVCSNYGNKITQPPQSEDELDDTTEDGLADDSRPSLNLYFPLQSDLSSELSPDRLTGDVVTMTTTPGDVVTPVTMTTVTPVTPVTVQPRNSSPTSVKCESSSSDVLSTVTMTTVHDSLVSGSTISGAQSLERSAEERQPLDLSALIKEQLKINEELKGMGKPLNTSIEMEEITQKPPPPPISYTKTSRIPPHASLSRSTISSSSSFEEIIQELLTSSQESQHTISSIQESESPTKSFDFSGNSKMSDSCNHDNSDSLSQHTISSQNGSLVSQRLTPGDQSKQSSVWDVSYQNKLSSGHSSNLSNISNHGNLSNISNHGNLSNISKASSSSSKVSISSGLSELQKQLTRINTHLSEIEKIKDNDAIFYL